MLAAGAALVLGAVPAAQAQPASVKRPKLVLAGPFALVSYPLMRIADSGALNDVAEQVEFTTWKNPDQLRALAIQSSADLVAMPSNVAANLYNHRGELMDIQLVGVLDLLIRDRQGNLIAVDHKTSRQAKSQADVDGDLQLTAYSYLLVLALKNDEQKKEVFLRIC